MKTGKSLVALCVFFAGISAFADLPWPATLTEQVATRKAAVVPSGDYAAYGASGSFDSICRIVRHTNGQNFLTTRFSLVVSFK